MGTRWGSIIGANSLHYVNVNNSQSGCVHVQVYYMYIQRCLMDLKGGGEPILYIIFRVGIRI